MCNDSFLSQQNIANWALQEANSYTQWLCIVHPWHQVVTYAAFSLTLHSAYCLIVWWLIIMVHIKVSQHLFLYTLIQCGDTESSMGLCFMHIMNNWLNTTSDIRTNGRMSGHEYSGHSIGCEYLTTHSVGSNWKSFNVPCPDYS